MTTMARPPKLYRPHRSWTRGQTTTGPHEITFSFSSTMTSPERRRARGQQPCLRQGEGETGAHRQTRSCLQAGDYL